MKIRNTFLAGALALALIGCGGNSAPVQTTTQQVCPNGQQPLPLANGGLICPNGQAPVAQTVVVQPQQDNFWQDMFMYHMLFGSPSYGPGWFGGSQYSNRTTINNHYYGGSPYSRGETPRNYTTVPPRASSNSGLNIYSSKPASPSSNFRAFSGKPSGSDFNSFSSNANKPFSPSIKSWGSNNSSNFNSFRAAPSYRSPSFGGRSFGRSGR